ncbi:hypothetical protein D3C78_1314800 [compost metagenome]
MGVCRSCEIAARIWTRSSRYWATRSRIALKARAAWATSLGPLSLIGNPFSPGSSASAAAASALSGLVVCRTANQVQRRRSAICAAKTYGSHSARGITPRGVTSIVNGEPSDNVRCA